MYYADEHSEASENLNGADNTHNIVTKFKYNPYTRDNLKNVFSFIFPTQLEFIILV